MERQTFIWSNKNGTPKMFKVYKLTLAFYMVVACRYGYTDQKNFPKIYHSKFEKVSHKILKKIMISVNFAYTDYISKWADLSCASWGVLCAKNAFFRDAF